MKAITFLFAIVFISIPCVAIGDLVAHWKLDEGSGSTAYDSAGSNDGTLYGDPEWDPNGQVDGALEFDGSDDYVDIVGYKGVTGTGSRTCAAWIRSTTAGAVMYWGDSTLAGSKWVFIVQDSAVGTAGAIRVSVGGGGYIIGSTDLRDNAWHHVAAVLADDGSPNSNEIKLYVDSIAETNSASTSVAIDTIGTDDVMIGGTVSSLFTGTIDDVRIYDRALSAQELERLYLEGLSGLSIIPLEDLDSTGEVGGPFAPLSKVYQLNNITSEVISWDVSNNEIWLDIDTTSGVLDPNDSVDVTLSLNSNADILLGGIYTDTITFSNITDPCEIINQTREVTLRVFSLIAHWKLDEISGSAAYDSAGSNDGTLNGGPVWDPAGGKINGALEFDGINDHVEITGYKGVTGTDPRTCAAWIKTDAIGAIISWGQAVTSGKWLVQLNSSAYGNAGALRVSVAGGYIIGSTDLSDSAWHHVAAVYDSSISTDVVDIELYVDGVLEVISTSSSQLINTGNTIDVDIGASISGALFTGSIDAVRIYDGALSAEKVAELYLESPYNLSVTPEVFISSGYIEGPFSPVSKGYQLANIGDDPLWWDVQYSAGWLDIDITSGVLDPNDSIDVTVSINSSADLLPAGVYNETIAFIDITDPCEIIAQTRPVTLTVNAAWTSQIDLPNDPFIVPGSSDGNPGWIKFTSILKSGFDPNIVYYQDSVGYPFHYNFAMERLEPFLGMTVPEFFDIALYETGQEASLGAVIVPYDPGVLEYGIQFIRYDAYAKEQIVEMFNHIKTTITAPGYTAYYFPTYEQYPEAESNRDWLLSQGVAVGSISQWSPGNICYSEGWGLGELKYFDGSMIQNAYVTGQLKPGDILLTDGIPAEIPDVAGIITLSPTTPNSHVVILAQTYGIPMVYLETQADIDTAGQMLGFKVVLCVEEDAGVCNVDITDAEAFFTQVEIDDMLALKAPGSLNFSVIASYGDYSADANGLLPADIQYFGGKAANYGMLRRAIRENSPEAIGISFDLWNEFLDQPIVPRASVTVEPNSFELFWADRDMEQGSNHADFKLNDEGEYIGLYDRDGITLIDGLSFGLQSSDVSYGRSIDGGGTWQFFGGGSATPGGENSPGSSSVGGLVINEFMAENDLFIQDNFGEYDDWFELYNGSGSTIDLGGMYLTDDAADPTDWMIPPAVTGSTLRKEIANRLGVYSYPPTDMSALSEDLSAIRSLFKNTYITSFTSAQILAIETVLQNNFDVNEKIRFRSSTNVEDSDQFVGAGLYDSYSGCLADDLDGDTDGPSICDPAKSSERGVFRAIRKVFASFYNDNAFLERLKYSVDPNDVGMALLVHHSFPDEIELANGVATLEKSSTGPEKTIKLITQNGATSVANPIDGSIPEEVSVYVNGSGVITPTFISGSNLVILGEKVMDWQSDYIELAQLLVDASVEFENQTGKNDYILDFEYKKLDPGGAAIPAGGIIVKQIREIPQPDPCDLECPTPTPPEEPTSCLSSCEYYSGSDYQFRSFTSLGVTILTSYYLYCPGGFCVEALFSHWNQTVISGLTSQDIYLYSCQSQCYDAEHHNWCENFYFEPMYEPGISQSILDELRALDIKGIELYNVTYCGTPGIRYYPYDADPPATPGDFEPDGDVDLADFSKINQYWLSSNCGTCGGYDLTGDGNINIDDLIEFANWWMTGL